MPERTTLEVIAPTVEEALSQGLAQLGLTAADVSVEVLDSGSKGFLGLGGRQVRILISVNPPPGSMKAESAPASKPDRKPAAPSRTESKPKPDSRSKPNQQKERKEAPRQQQPAAPRRDTPKEPVKMEAKPEPRTPAEHDALLDRTEALISRLLHLMGLQAQVSAHYGDDDRADRRSIVVDVRGEDLSSLVGRHAETLNAFQHVTSLMVGKEAGQWVQLKVDVEGYRSRREKQLEQLAKRMAEQVIKTGKKATLEPMPSEERRAIHIALRGHPAVSTESTGDEPRRKVVIVPKK